MAVRSMDYFDEIKEMMEEIEKEIKDVSRVDAKSYQVGVYEGLTMALEILGQQEQKNN
jgi:hypothetical protein